MKYIALVIFCMASSLYSMHGVNSEVPAFKKQTEAANLAICYKNAGLLIPDRLLFEMHPNVKGYWMQYNQQLIAHYTAKSANKS